MSRDVSRGTSLPYKQRRMLRHDHHSAEVCSFASCLRHSDTSEAVAKDQQEYVDQCVAGYTELMGLNAPSAQPWTRVFQIQDDRKRT